MIFLHIQSVYLFFYLRNESVFRKCRTHKMHLSKTLTFKKYAHLDTNALFKLAILTISILTNYFLNFHLLKTNTFNNKNVFQQLVYLLKPCLSKSMFTCF